MRRRKANVPTTRDLLRWRHVTCASTAFMVPAFMAALCIVLRSTTRLR
jgi:hypothetical protein